MNPLLKKEAFKNTYKHQLYPVLKQAASLSTWQYTSTYCRKGTCRPETKRKREAGEGKTFRISSSFKCSNYDEWGEDTILGLVKLLRDPNQWANLICHQARLYT